jgi:hypothetical protein
MKSRISAELNTPRTVGKVLMLKGLRATAKFARTLRISAYGERKRLLRLSACGLLSSAKPKEKGEAHSPSIKPRRQGKVFLFFFAFYSSQTSNNPDYATATLLLGA